MKHHQKGFTLVEIAIVLVIIGLLLGGVLKGQELINSAKVKNLANDFRSISAFVYAYQDKYRALPGDDRAATDHLGAAAVCARVAACTPAAPPAGLGDGRINGVWIGAAQTDESYMFWQHVRVANIATGTAVLGAADYIPRNAEGGDIGITGDPIIAGWNGTFYICSSGIQGRYVRQIDIMMDDGNTQTGSVRVVADRQAAPAQFENIVAGTAQDSQLFTVCFAS